MRKFEKQFYEVREIGIWDQKHQKYVGELKKIIYPTDGEIKMLALWRRRNQKTFKDDHYISYRGTRKWWFENMEGNPIRILFWVCDLWNQRIGHMGLNKNELDNVIRGTKEYPGMMQLAVDALLEWGGFRKYFVRTRFNNSHAIEFYEKCGFRKVKQEDERVRTEFIYARIH